MPYLHTRTQGENWLHGKISDKEAPTKVVVEFQNQFEKLAGSWFVELNGSVKKIREELDQTKLKLLKKR